MRDFFNKIGRFFSSNFNNLKLWYLNKFTVHQRKIFKRVLYSLAGVLVVLFLFGWYFRPAAVVNRANNAAIHKGNSTSIVNDPNGNYKYGKVNGVPDLQTLLEYRRINQTLTKRGDVAIPKYSVDTPIYEGVSNLTLSWGAGTAKPNEKMGKKNFALSAHNYMKLAKANNWFFSNFQTQVAPVGDVTLQNVAPQLGTKIYTRDNKKLYTYKLFKRQIVDVRYSDSGHVLDDSRVNEVYSKKKDRKPIITLTTCYEQKGILHPSQRIVLVGKLQKVQSVKNVHNMKKLFPNSYK